MAEFGMKINSYQKTSFGRNLKEEVDGREGSESRTMRKLEN